MATLPTYRRQVLGTGIRPSAGGGASVSPQSPTGAALQGLSQDLSRVAGVAGQVVADEARQERERVENQAAMSAANMLSEGQVYWQQNYQERTQAWSPGAPDMREGINSDFDQWARDTEAKLPTEASKRYFQQHALGIKTKMLTGAYGYQQKATSDALTAQTAVGVKSDERVVYADATQFQATRDRRVETIRARTDLTDAEKIVQVDRYDRGLALAAERGELERDPAGWYEKRFGTPGTTGSAGAGGGPAAYSTTFGNGKYVDGGDLTTKTLGQIEELGNRQIEATKGKIGKGDQGTSALGAYQFINGTRARVARELYGKDWKQITYTPQVQEAMAEKLFQDTKNGDLTQQWEGLKKIPGSDKPGFFKDKPWSEMRGIISRVESSDTTQAPLLASTDGTDVGPLTQGEYGHRPDGSQKGNGFLGPLRRPDGGVMTEYSVGVEINGKEMDIPTLVPTLTKREINHILNIKEGDRLPPEIIDKAVAFAEKRIKEGKPVFAEPNESPGAAALPTTPNTYNALDWEQQASLRAMAETKIRQGDARYKAGVTQQMRDAQAQHRDGIVDPVPIPEASFTRAFPEDGARLYQEYQNSRKMAADIGSFKTLPAGDIATVIAAGAPKPGEGYEAADQRQNLRIQAAQRVIQQRNADPAGYVVQNTPELAGLRARIDDPQTPPADKAAITQRYVTDSLAEQTRLGIAQPKVLTPGQADAIGQQAMAATRPEDSANLIASLEQQYGKHFPRVFNELVAGKKLANELIIIPNLPTPAARETVSRLARVKETDLTQGIDAKDQKSVKDLVTTNLEAMAATIPLLTEQSSEVMNAYETTMRKAAYGFMAGGMSPSDAVTRAQSLLLGQYQFSGSIRVPRGLDTSAVQQGTQSRLYDSLDGIDVPRDLIAGARNPEQVQEEWLRTVRARPLWFTSDDDGGVGLWAQGADGVRYRVTKGGAPVSFTWAELQLPTRTPATVPQSQGGAAFVPPRGIRRRQ